MTPLANKLTSDQLTRLGVEDVRSDGRLSVCMRVTVTDGNWAGRTGTVQRIQRDASGAGPVHNIFVDLDGTCSVVFGPAFLNEQRMP